MAVYIDLYSSRETDRESNKEIDRKIEGEIDRDRYVYVALRTPAKTYLDGLLLHLHVYINTTRLMTNGLKTDRETQDR